MLALYVLPPTERPTWPTPALVQRGAALGCTPRVGDPTGLVTKFPSVVVTSSVLAPAVAPDTSDQLTVADVETLKQAALSAEGTRAAKIAAAMESLATAVGGLAAGLAQGKTDLATLAAITAKTPPTRLTPLVPILSRAVEQEMAIAQGIADLLVVLEVIKPTGV